MGAWSKGREGYILAGGAVILAVIAAVFLWTLSGAPSGVSNPNLALGRGVKATCDSVEQEALSADKAIDGDGEDRASRWSSENDREDGSHYIRLEFPEEISVSFVVLKWERPNATSYALEGSLDGESYETLASFETAPETLTQEIPLEEPAAVRFLRLSTYAVSREAAYLFDLYQNVSLYEFEVYRDKPAAYRLEMPVIEQMEAAEGGGRRLRLPEAPAGFRVSLIGADLEQVIGADGTVYDTIQDKEVTVGCLVEDLQGREGEREVAFTLEVPAAGKAQGAAGSARKNERPAGVIPAIQEWDGGQGYFALGGQPRIIVDAASCPLEKNMTYMSLKAEGQEAAEEATNASGGAAKKAANQKVTDMSDNAAARLWQVAALLQEQYLQKAGGAAHLTVQAGSLADAAPGDIYLGYAAQAGGLGDEGYAMEISDICVIKAEAVAGLRWGTVTLLQLLFPEGESAPQPVPKGRIRDYPRYPLRGFGIDVARKAVSLDTLRRMVEELSWRKMNDLSLHLNDNEILSTSGLAGSVEQAMTAQSAFRLESEALGVQAGGEGSGSRDASGDETKSDGAGGLAEGALESGSAGGLAEGTLESSGAGGLTEGILKSGGGAVSAEDYVYSKEDLAAFIRWAKTYGVNVTPEIDTPAHSLAITKKYPAYALQGNAEAVDQLDLGNPAAVALVEEIWREALFGGEAPFLDAETVNIGMDEYYGDGEQYRQFLLRIRNLARDAGKKVRIWGSLGRIAGTTAPDPEGLQLNLWSSLWADPLQMYEAGYSLINMQNSHLYIIPGGGYDNLNLEELYRGWEPGRFYDYDLLERIPAYSPQLLGAAYMIWNDMSGALDLGLCEYDLYRRFKKPLALLCAKLWGMGEGQDFAFLQGAAGYRDLNAGELYDTSVGFEEYRLTGSVFLEQGASAKDPVTGKWKAVILSEGESAYGDWAFYLVEPESGKVGFAREGKTYAFDCRLPEAAWVKLTLSHKRDSGSVTLTVEEEGSAAKTYTLGDAEPFSPYATFVFPNAAPTLKGYQVRGDFAALGQGAARE